MVKEKTYSGKKLYQYITRKLKSVWGSETEALSKYILKEIFNYNLTDFISEIPKKHSKIKLDQLNAIINRLENQEPIQYILGYTYFLDRRFIVTPDVLIPRPETEELVIWIRDKNNLNSPSILDIGVGSGCIGVSLCLEIGVNKFTGLDCNQSITDIAVKNARNMGVAMKTMNIDILHEEIPGPGYDIIVSNPPYVLPSEKSHMRKNVLDYEPVNALFVPEDKPLIFYHRIAEIAIGKLNRNGMLFFEINESFSTKVKEVLQKWNFSSIEIKKDIHGKDRFVGGQMPYS